MRDRGDSGPRTRRRGRSVVDLHKEETAQYPAQGGAGSKRRLLGCDPGAGCSTAKMMRGLTHASAVTSPARGPCSTLRRAGQNRPVPQRKTGLCQVRRLRRRDRWSVEQGPRCFLRGCDRATGQSTSPPVYARLRGQIPKGAPLPRCDVPCEGSSLSCLARLASIRTWRNARRVGYSELP